MERVKEDEQDKEEGVVFLIAVQYIGCLVLTFSHLSTFFPDMFTRQTLSHSQTRTRAHAQKHTHHTLHSCSGEVSEAWVKQHFLLN